MKQYLEVGEFVTTHGVVGELKLYPWSDSPDFLMQFTTLYLSASGEKPLHVKQLRVHKNMCLVLLEGVESVAAARPYIGKTVYIDRDDVKLREGRVFVQDLLGAAVKNADSGEEYGHIMAITHPGRHDVYEIKAADGQIFLFPAVEAFLEKIDIENACVLVRPIEGMFAAEEEKPVQQKHEKKRKQPADDGGEGKT